MERWFVFLTTYTVELIMIVLGVAFNIIVVFMRKKLSTPKKSKFFVIGYLFVGFTVIYIGVSLIMIDLKALLP